MLTTEEEAREKWCPQGRKVENQADQASLVTNETSYCIASECMMWRYTSTSMSRNESHFSITSLNKGDVKCEETLPESRGYCGLAGRSA